MLFADRLVLVRGGGDLASGVVVALRNAGFPVVVLELAAPLAVRRTVSFASAVTDGATTVEGVIARRVDDSGEALQVAGGGEVAVLVNEHVPPFPKPAAVVVDGRMAKRNIDTRIDQAPLVVALGPGFAAGVDCDAVIETKRGHRLGRVIWDGPAASDTGVPGTLGGASADRVIRAPADGIAGWSVGIGDAVKAGEQLGAVGGDAVTAAIGGVVRGLIAPGHAVTTGMKIGDIDPRADRATCFEISDKSRLVGAGVLQAVLTWLDGTTS
jgi:xanthine dehydrogenase accessory factor